MNFLPPNILSNGFNFTNLKDEFTPKMKVGRYFSHPHDGGKSGEVS